MSYTKTTWNDLTAPAIDATNLNKIEQGIYDNSIDITSINTLIGSSGTATTTQTDYTEGQLTQKLGLKYIKMKGQTSQDTTNGYQLLDRTKGRDTYTYKGITTTYNADGSVTMRGTTTEAGNMDGLLMGNWGLSNKLIDLDTSSQYVLRAVGNTNSKILLILVNGNNVIASSSGSTPTVFTPSYDGVTLFMIRYTPASANETIDLTVYPMLSKGNNTTYPYEPFTNGASPNPSYPQEVNNVSGSNILKVCNKNLIDITCSNQSNKGINLTNNNNGTVTLNGTATATSGSLSLFSSNTSVPVSSLSGTITFSTKEALPSGVELALAYGDSTGTWISNIARLDSTSHVKTATISPPSNAAYIRANFSITNGTAINNLVVSPQIEIGSTATSFIAHKEEDYYIDLGNINSFANIDTQTLNGMTIKRTNNGYILNGTTTANTTFRGTIANPKNTNKTLVIKCDTAITNANIQIKTRDSGGAQLRSISLSTANVWETLSGTYTDVMCDIYIKSGVTLTNVLVQPMLLEGTVTNVLHYVENIDIDYTIELCKLGNYQDYIYKNNGKWYKHNEIGKKILNGTETWNSMGWTDRYAYRVAITDMKQTTANSDSCSAISNYYKAFSQNDLFNASNTYGIANRTNTNELILRNDDCTTGTALTTALSTNNVTIYYQKVTPTIEEITYEPLLRQLDKLDKIGLYDISNISQDNSDMKMLLDFTICNDNYNGLREFIRS